MQSDGRKFDRSDQAEDRAILELSQKLGHLANFSLEYARSISERLTVWLVIGNVGAIAIAIALATQSPTPIISTEGAKSSIVLFLTGAGFAFGSAYLTVLNFIFLFGRLFEMQFVIHRYQMASTMEDEMQELALSYRDAKNAEEFERIAKNSSAEVIKVKEELDKLKKFSCARKALFVVGAVGFVGAILAFVAGVSILLNTTTSATNI